MLSILRRTNYRFQCLSHNTIIFMTHFGQNENLTTARNNNIIITSNRRRNVVLTLQRRFYVIMTFSLRHMSAWTIYGLNWRESITYYWTGWSWVIIRPFFKVLQILHLVREAKTRDIVCALKVVSVMISDRHRTPINNWRKWTKYDKMPSCFMEIIH